jgi:RHS repeat-associated protein
MEPVNAPSEEVQFANLTATRASGNAQAGSYAALVNYQKVLGPFKTLKVNKDDVINAEVWAYYTTTTAGSPVALTTYISNGANVTGGEESGKNLPLLNVGISYNPAPTPATGTPKAYLKYIFYDKNYTHVSSQTVNVGTAGAWHQLTLPTLTASTDGYVQIFVANESDKNALFDNLKITYTEPMVVQENHYSPWGLNLAGIEKQGQPNDKFQYNGKEKHEEFGLNWNDYGARMYDPQLGRWHTLDILAEEYDSWSPYHFVHNNPIKLYDPDGREIINGAEKGTKEYEATENALSILQKTNPEAYNTLQKSTIKCNITYAQLNADEAYKSGYIGDFKKGETQVNYTSEKGLDATNVTKDAEGNVSGGDLQRYLTFEEQETMRNEGKEPNGVKKVISLEEAGKYVSINGDVEIKLDGSLLKGGLKELTAILGHEFGHALFSNQKTALSYLWSLIGGESEHDPNNPNGKQASDEEAKTRKGYNKAKKELQDEKK